MRKRRCAVSSEQEALSGNEAETPATYKPKKLVYMEEKDYVVEMQDGNSNRVEVNVDHEAEHEEQMKQAFKKKLRKYSDKREIEEWNHSEKKL